MTQNEYEQKRNELWYEYTAMLRRNCASRYVFDKIFNRAYALGKQEKDAEGTVISGWVCRDKKDNALNLHAEKPYRAQSGYDVSDEPDWWESDCASFLPLDKNLFPDLTWDSDPEEVEIIIKRKKK